MIAITSLFVNSIIITTASMFILAYLVYKLAEITDTIESNFSQFNEEGDKLFISNGIV